MHPILLNGQWRPASSNGDFTGFNPATAEPLADRYPISAWDDCQAALDAASHAADALADVPANMIADFLQAYSDRLEAQATDICQTAESETALPVQPRLQDVELPRTVNQLRLAATAARDETWRDPVCDAEAGIYTCRAPLGPVLVMGPNNFPLAFNAISGGDFAAAIAAGNPVIAKAHPCQPSTTRLLAEQAQAAADEANLPAGTVQLLYGIDPKDGLRMVADPRLGAVAMTGSRQSGLALKAAADEVGKPIYLEMSSVNPVFFLPGAVAAGADDLAAELAGSCLLGGGQFCTCPNLFVLVKSGPAERFVKAVREQLESKPAPVLLARNVVETLESAIARLRGAGAEVLTGGQVADGPGYRFQNTLLRTTAEQFLREAVALQTEAFGPATMAVVAESPEQAIEVANHVEGSLTASMYVAADGSDDAVANRLMRVLRRRAGRLLTNKMPTGVAVSPAMNHGGPFPATGHPGFTAVGLPAAIRRFTKLDCYDNVPSHLRPECLR